MTGFSPELIAKWTEGRWNFPPKEKIAGFSIDTRVIRERELFIAIKSERDGHDFLKLAKERGAAGALVSRIDEKFNFPQLKVEDTLSSFQKMGLFHRKNYKGKVIGITGSCGKTSTKEMLGLLLGKGSTVWTHENLNNFLGVPLTLLRIQHHFHDCAVIEAGINELGEMSKLTEMISPNIVIISMIGHSHLKGLGTLDDVAKEKAKLFQESSNLEKVILPESCLQFEPFKELIYSSGRSLILKKGKPPCPPDENQAYFDFWTETNKSGDFSMLRLWRHKSPVFSISFPSMSDGMVSNLALSLLAAFQLGVTTQEISERLPHYRPTALRGKCLQGRGRTYFVDCYNANPNSMQDSINYFSQRFHDQPKMYVLGGMEELGKEEKRLHVQVALSHQIGVHDLVVMIGEKARWMAEGYLENGIQVEQLISLNSTDDARPIIDDFEGAILFKGSRKNRLEDLIPAWAVGGSELEELLKC